MAKLASFKVAPWKHMVRVIYGPRRTCSKWIVEAGYSGEIDKDSDGQAFYMSGEPIVIWVDDIYNIPTLAHELLHAVIWILKDAGIKLCRSSEETYTYTLGNLMNDVLECKKWKTL